MIVLGICLGTVTAFAQAKATARSDARQIEIGDQFHLFLEVQVPAGSGKLSWAAIPELPGLEIVDTGSVDSVLNGKDLIYKQKLTLTGFDSGVYVIPAFTFPLTEASGNTLNVVTDTLALHVRTLAVDTTAPIKPIKDIEEVERDWWSYWPWFLGGLIALVVLVLLLVRIVKSISRKRKSAAKGQEKADQKALRLLKELEATHFEGEDGQKKYFSMLTQVIKDYIEARFGISIAEMTTDELLKATKQNNELRHLRAELKLIFRTADLAKFAKATPGQEAQSECLDAAVLLVRKTPIVQEEGTPS
ncbi:MAG: hypothetical protein BGO31_03500 [Bacteroidetes bacterium 43-16]|nr:MAG: hypothetical protein BGO31_03500 [Bacteroidetes bacterium 43-16]